MPSNVPATATLPPELIDIVIDHLFNDKANLSSCSLVSYSWLLTSRYHLFSDITIKGRSTAQFIEFLTFLRAHPDIACYIQSLKLIGKNLKYDSVGNITENRIILCLHFLSRTLSELPNLQELHIYTVKLSGEGCEGEGHALTAPPHSVKLREVVLDSVGGQRRTIHDMHDLFFLFSECHRLSIRSVLWAPMGYTMEEREDFPLITAETGMSSKLVVRSLIAVNVFFYHPLYHFLCDNISPHSLAAATLHCNTRRDKDISVMGDFLIQISEHLSRLELNLMHVDVHRPYSSPAWRGLKLSSCTLLNSLTLSIALHDGLKANYNTAACTFILGALPTTPPAIPLVVINFTLSGEDQYGVLEESMDWERLAKVLRDLQHPGLVVFYLNSNVVMRCRNLVKERLTEFGASNLVQIS